MTTELSQLLVVREGAARAFLATLALLLFSTAGSAQPTLDLRDTVGKYVTGTTTHGQFAADMRSGSWIVGEKKIQSEQNPDKSWAVFIRYRIEGAKGASCTLEFSGPLEKGKSLDETTLSSVNC